MRAARTVFLIWLLCELAIWIRAGRGFCVLEALPFVERSDSLSPDYDWFALAALLIGLWGYLLLSRRTGGEQQQKNGTTFRTGIILVPLTVIGLAWVSRHLRPAVGFAELVGPEKLHEHVYLAALCVLVFAVLLAIKRFRK